MNQFNNRPGCRRRRGGGGACVCGGGIILNQVIDATTTLPNLCVQLHLSPLMFDAKLFTWLIPTKGQRSNPRKESFSELWGATSQLRVTLPQNRLIEQAKRKKIKKKSNNSPPRCVSLIKYSIKCYYSSGFLDQRQLFIIHLSKILQRRSVLQKQRRTWNTI